MITGEETKMDTGKNEEQIREERHRRIVQYSEFLRKQKENSHHEH